VFNNYGINLLKNSECLWRKKALQDRYGLRVNPTLHFLPSPLHADEAGSTKFLYMMRNRGGYNTQVLAEFADTDASFGLDAAVNASWRSWLATGDQAQEYLQPVWV